MRKCSFFRYTKTSPSISYAENPNSHRSKNNSEKKEVKSDEKTKKDDEKSKKNVKSSKDSKEKPKDSDKKLVKTPSKESLDVNNKKPESNEKHEPEVKKLDEKNDKKIELDKEKQESVSKSPLKPNKSPEKLKIPKTPEKLEEKPSEKLKVELKIERKKSPRRIEKPKVNIFLEDSDEVDEFEKITTEVKSRWSSPEMFKPVAEVPQIVPAPIVEYKMSDPEIPVVVESPERSPVIPNLSNNIFDPSLVTMEKSPTPSPPPRPTKVRNVCSFLSDIASGNMFSGLGLGSGLYDNDSSIVGLKLSLDETAAQLPEVKKLERKIIFETDKIMEPDTTADKLVDKAPEKVTSDSDSDDSDSDTSSSSDSDSDDTTSESEDSSEESSDDDVPSFTRGFGRFDASSMPMVTQIKPTTAAATPTTHTVVASRFQPHQSIVKPPGLLTSITKPTLYTPATVQAMPTVATPFSVGAFAFPIPFKIYSLRDNNSEMIFPSSIQPPATVVTPSPTPTSDKSEKDKKSTSDKDRRERKRSRSHSRDRDKKRFKDDRRKTPPRKRSTSPSKKRHADDRRQTEERKDSRRRDSSPRHSSHSSRSSHASR